MSKNDMHQASPEELALIFGQPAAYVNNFYLTIEADGATAGLAGTARLALTERNSALRTPVLRAVVAMNIPTLLQLHAAIGAMLADANIKTERPEPLSTTTRSMLN